MIVLQFLVFKPFLKMIMNIKITGASGYLGQLLTTQLIQRGYSVTNIKRDLLYGDIGTLKSNIKGVDVVINLAGSSILKRWTETNKKKIYKL